MKYKGFWELAGRNVESEKKDECKSEKKAEAEFSQKNFQSFCFIHVILILSDEKRVIFRPMDF